MWSAAFLHSCCVTVRQPGLSVQNPSLITLNVSFDGLMVEVVVMDAVVVVVMVVVGVVVGKGVVVATMVVVVVMGVVVVVVLVKTAELQTYCAK